tara:strand:- start:2342 stop:2893 length:552 start_codon:yes stop_codon:yes gene_type:complete
MLKRNVIASGITNLTDARYFASYGVDYLLFDLREIGINDIMAITGWLEGVKILIKMNEENIHLIDEVLVRISPFAIGSSKSECLRKILQYTSDGYIFHIFPADTSENTKVVLTHVDFVNPDTFHIDSQSTTQAFLEVNPTEEDITEFLNKSEAGVILKGSSEIETGLKSFDNMDLLFEILEEN